MKKVLKTLLVVTVLALVLTAFTGCELLDKIMGLLPSTECEHTGGTATCAAQAICEKCGEPYGEKLAHTPQTILEIHPTCTEAGRTEGSKCSVCGDILVATEEVPATGHDYFESGCLNTCLNCGKVEGEHTWADATCTEPKTCTECGKTDGKANGHKGGTPTCTEQAECETCHEKYGDLAKHTEVDIPEVAADCGNAGSTGGKKCSVCEKVTVEPTVVPATGAHTEEEIEAVEPTCAESGWTAGKKCSVCGEIIVKPTEVAATGEHSMVWVTTPPTATEKGHTVASCKNCDTKTVEYDYVSAITEEGSYVLTWEDIVGVAGTEKKGTYGEGDVVVRKDVFALHTGKKIITDNGKDYSWADGYTSEGRINFGSKTQFKSAGYITNGIEITITQKATVKVWWMNATTEKDLKENINRQIGIYDLSGKVVAQSNAEGVKDTKEIYEVELEPGTYIIGNVENHNYICKIGVYVCSEHSWKDATCTEAKTCTKCGLTNGEALGHDWKDATCTDPKTCDRCKATEGEAKGHTYVDGYCACGAMDADYTFSCDIADLTSSDSKYLNHNVTFTGTVTKIKDEWNTSFNNISVYVSDGNGNEILVYRMKTKVELCDTVTVTGKFVQYYSTLEIDSGATATIGEKNHIVEAKCDADATCPCGEKTIVASGHHYENGACTICGAEEGSTTVSVTIEKYADDNNWANGTQYSDIALDENITVTATGGTNTGKYYTSGEQWRAYQGESPSIVVTAANGKTIVSVKITYKVDKTGVLTLNGSNITSETTVEVNGSSVEFGVGNTGTATNGQVRITAIEVIYE